MNGSLSHSQRWFWLLDRLVGQGTVYIFAEAHRIRGPLEVEALERSLELVFSRHEALRTAFKLTPHGPQALPGAAALPGLRLIALDAGARAASRLRIAVAHCRAASEEPFDLEQGPLLRALLLRLSPDDHVLFFGVHHIAADGWSMTIIRRELSQVYACLAAGWSSKLPEPPSYSEAAAARAARLEGERPSLERFWDSVLRGAPVATELPLDHPRPARWSPRGAELRRRLSAATVGRLRSVARSLHATDYAVLLTAFVALVHRWSGARDLVIAVPTTGREYEEENIVGCFINTLPVRLTVADGETFASLVKKASGAILDGLANQDLPLDTIVRRLGAERDLSHPPLAQLCFNGLDYPAAPLRLVGAKVQRLHVPRSASLFDLTMYVDRDLRLPQLALAYSVALFDRRRMESFLAEYVQFLDQALANPDSDLRDYSLVTEHDRPCLPNPRLLLDGSWQGSIPELFQQRAADAPDAHAIGEGNRSWSYAEVAGRSGRLAAELRGRGIGRGDTVAVLADRSWMLPVAMLGILEAASAFLILDTAYPVERLRFLLAAARPAALVVAAELSNCGVELVVAQWMAEGRRPLLTLPDTSLNNARRLARRPSPVCPDDLAYLAFTSGSTGKPKGILGRHGPLTHFLPWLAAEFGLQPADRFAMLSGLSHDPLHREVFTPLALGASVQVPPTDALQVPARLAGWIVEAGITVVHLTPGLLRLVTQGFDQLGGTRSSLRLAFCVGDVLTWCDVSAFHRIAAPGAGVVALYGTTETQRAVSYALPGWRGSRPAAVKRCRGDEVEIPLGWGIPDVQLLVVNERGRLAGVGELGEIVFRSPHLARGYLDDAQGDAGRFGRNPWAADSSDSSDRIYRTGDLGRYRPHGAVAFVGRADRQVQVRGFRVELTEVEAAIVAQPGVRDAVVEAVQLAGEDRLKGMRAYVVADSDDCLLAVVRSLRRTLPGHLVPDSLIAVPAIPLTPNGKVDRAALQGRAADSMARSRTAGPASRYRAMEDLICSAWSEITVSPFPASAADVSLTGNSLALVQLHARLQEVLARRIDPTDMFRHREAASLARALAEDSSG